MSRGPTWRVRHMIDKGEISSDLIRAADHEADLLGHPYIGLEHLELARFGLAGDVCRRDRLRAMVAGEVRHRWWQIRGGRSALRRAGRAQTDATRREAEARERSRPDG
jgi:hypothetical protein